MHTKVQTLSSASILVIILVLAAPQAGAAPDLFVNTSGLKSNPVPPVVKSRDADVDMTVVNAAKAAILGGGAYEVNVNLFTDTSFIAKLDTLEEMDSDTFVLSGEILNQELTLVAFSFDDGYLTGEVEDADGTYYHISCDQTKRITIAEMLLDLIFDGWPTQEAHSRIVWVIALSGGKAPVAPMILRMKYSKS